MQPHHPLRFLNPVAAFLVMLGLCANEHFVAWDWIRTVAPRYVITDPGTTARIALVELVQANLWVALPYTVAVVAGLVWVGSTAATRLFVWGTFALLASPCLVYLWACLRIGNKFLNLSVPS